MKIWTTLLVLAPALGFAAPKATPKMTNDCLETAAMAAITRLEKAQPKADVHLVKNDAGRVIGLTDSEDVYTSFEVLEAGAAGSQFIYSRMKVGFTSSDVTVIVGVEFSEKKPACEVTAVQSIEPSATVMKCTETEASKKENGYGRDITLIMSKDQKKALISSPATEYNSAFVEVISQDDEDTTDSEDGNQDEDYDRKTESRYTGSDDLTSTDTGTNIFIDKKILAVQSGTLRLSGGQGNDGESGPAILWFENAALNCSAL